jgi:hypothetical protein
MSDTGIRGGTDGAALRTPLRAGPWTLVFDAGDVRYLRLGGHEVIRRIYGAVRDENWETVPGEVTDLDILHDASGFRIRYISTHRRGSIHFTWRAVISGDERGTVRFDFDGEAVTSFRRNRIGLCVLHPLSCVGARCRVRRRDGSRAELRLPELVEPSQPVPGIFDLGTFAHEIAPGAWAQIEYDGERFEMEDQRNWIDASFKTYGTPLREPFPVTIPAGLRVRQSVTVRLVEETEGTPRPPTRAARPSRVRVSVGEAAARLPRIGLQAGERRIPLSQREVSLLRVLDLAHLRVDLRLARGDWPGGLDGAVQQARALDVPLELALHLPREDEGSPAAAVLAEHLRTLGVPLARVLPFREGDPVTTTSTHALVLGLPGMPGTAVGAGTDADFYQLNQNRARLATSELVHWSMNPQVHATDSTSIMETPAAIPSQLLTARTLFPGSRFCISALTLKPRFNPVATSSLAAQAADDLPANVDRRQAHPVAACWFVAALKHLGEGGVESVTLTETVGARGLMEEEAGTRWPASFPSRPAQVFPPYHAIAAFTRGGEGRVIVTRSSDPLRVETAGIESSRGRILLAANMTGELQSLEVDTSAAVRACSVQDWATPQSWMFDPLSWLDGAGTPSAARGRNVVDLPPHALAWLDLTP